MDSKISLTVLLSIFLIAIYPWDVDTASRDYCLTPMNISNCGIPSAVYSYYKPGSMCIITLWRGCPTKNKFDHIDQCNSLCIKNTEGEVNKCHVPLNTNHCTHQAEDVFTYSSKKQACVEAVWHGCSTLNKFNDEQSCMNACHNPKKANNRLDWTEKIKNSGLNFIKGLHTVVKELTKPETQKTAESVNENK